MITSKNHIISEIVILGGGIAGSVLAAKLATRFKVVLIERNFCKTDSHIVESLPASAIRILDMLGLNDAVENNMYLPYYGIISIWGNSFPTRYDFLQSPEGSGLHIDKRIFNSDLLRIAVERGVKLVYADKILGINKDLSIDLLSAGESFNIKSSIAVDATGRSAILGRKLNIKRNILGRLMVIYAVLPQALDPDLQYAGTTLIESVREGWWYAAPVHNGKQVVAFFTDGDMPDFKKMSQSKTWLSALKETRLISKPLNLNSNIPIRVFVGSANSVYSAETSGKNWLAIGDAAISFDPISSQGNFNALTTALFACEAISFYLQGNLNSLKEYSIKIKQVLSAYKDNLAQYYGYERRWKDSEFWQRRL